MGDSALVTSGRPLQVSSSSNGSLKLANLSVKRLHTTPITIIRSRADLKALPGHSLSEQEVDSFLSVPLVSASKTNRSPSSLSALSVRPSTSHTQPSTSRSFRLPLGYIQKRFVAEPPLELSDSDLKLLATLNHEITQHELVTAIYRWEIETVKQTVALPIGIELAKLVLQNFLTRTLSDSTVEKIHKYWLERFSANEGRPLCRCVWGYQQQLEWERTPLKPSAPRRTRK